MCSLSEIEDNLPQDAGAAGRKRRKRYTGTHPKHFEEKYKEHNIEDNPELAEKLRAKGKTPAGSHVPVMLEEVMWWLKPAKKEVVADCTLGYGGHAAEFIKRIGPKGRLIGFDVDVVQLEKTGERLAKLKTPVDIHHGNFAGIDKGLQNGLEGYDIIFADLGVSSMQIDDPARGMSYRHDGPLDMRMDNRLKVTAAELLAKTSEEELAVNLQELADEEDNRRIAAAVVAAREERAIESTRELVDIILAAKGLSREKLKKEKGAGGLHPAAKTFQAIRMMVNDELGSLAQLLRAAPWCLKAGGRIGVISFHSGEDRLVKKAFQEGLRTGVYEKVGNLVTASAAEIAKNPRSSSAKFRFAIKAR
jgi:16S rRNA (cytosine1402-N4)-methyltransferase